MKKHLIKIGVLVAAFLLSVFGFSRMTNKTNIDMTREMAPATLPTVTLFYGDTRINELKAYTAEMETRFMRDTITPLEDNHILNLEISGLRTGEPNLAWQLRTLNGETLLADGQVTEFTGRGSALRCEIEIQSIIDEGEEYSLILSLAQDDRVCRFYTRLLLSGNAYVREGLDFIMNFHNKALDKGSYETLSTWLEPDVTANNQTLQKVDIHSSPDQIGYGELSPSVLIQPVPRIVEINSSYIVVLMNYVLTRIGDDGATEYYNAEEYFRVRHTEEREYLLNYERTMNQLYRGETALFYDSLIQLGIRSEDVEYCVNEAGTAAAFVQEGELWGVNFSTGRLYRIFSFRGLEGIDQRENSLSHEIRIVNISEDGSVHFVVYGYMDRGEHEGECGIAVYHFDSLVNTIEKQVFIPSSRSFPVLRSNMDGVIYENEDGIFYFMLGGFVYQIDLNSRTILQKISSLNDGKWCVPESNRYLVYQSEGDRYSATELTILDFEDGTEFEITANEGEYLMPLGFMQEDLIYGVARASDIYVDAAGLVTFPMYKVCIMNAGEPHTLLKEYQKDGIFVQDISVSGYTIYLERLARGAKGYESIEQDTIMNREGEDMEEVTVQTTVTIDKETEVQIDLGKEIKNTAPKMLTPKEVMTEEDRTVTLPGGEKSNLYYAYAAGDVLLSSDIFRDAVIMADQYMGVVVDTDMHYLWMRARSLSCPPIQIDTEALAGSTGSIAGCVRGMLASKDISIDVESLLNSGQTPRQILESSLKDSLFLDLSGCDITETLYYISNGAPVFAMSGTDTAVLLVGYDGASVTWLDPVTTKHTTMEMTEAQSFFGECGNIFFTYTD
ncbi:MAG: hypothetical protein IJT05_07720 [Lachnospiraceae bacterium]|nr:hypothetical protein [Lachnospiraceae bacterium]